MLSNTWLILISLLIFLIIYICIAGPITKILDVQLSISASLLVAAAFTATLPWPLDINWTIGKLHRRTWIRSRGNMFIPAYDVRKGIRM